MEQKITNGQAAATPDGDPRPLITLKGIAAAYDGQTVLSGVDLTVYRRDFLGIIGPNGGGKTTLVRLILGLMEPSAGTITLHGPDGRPVGRLRMGYLPQRNDIDRKFPLTVYDTVLSGLMGEVGVWGRYKPRHHEAVRQTLTRMGLEGMESRPLGELSGGQLQRTLLGRALVARPDVLILDEPDTYLDRRHEARLYDLLEEANRECAVILVSHDIGVVLQNVRSIACVNRTLDYHPATTAVTPGWIEEHFGCPLDLLGHGHLPHRMLHAHEERQEEP